MAQRFNPPPNWPAPPSGWTPRPGWQPDPASGTPPPGHQLWIQVGRGGWFRRHKVITLILVVLLIGGISNLANDEPATDAAALRSPLIGANEASNATPTPSASDSAAAAAASLAVKRQAAEAARKAAAAAAKQKEAAAAKRKAAAAAKRKAAAVAAKRKAAALAKSQADVDPRFPYCKDLPAGYGPYFKGRDPEYYWYRDADNDGEVCE